MRSHKTGWRRLAELSSLGLILPSSIIIGLFFGYWLDKLLGTHPWMLLIFTIFGIISGLSSLLRAVKKINSSSDKEE